MNTMYVNTPIGTLKIEVTGCNNSAAGGVAIYLQDEDALYPIVTTEYRNHSIETSVFQDQDHLDEPIEVKHSGLPTAAESCGNRVVDQLTMLEYLKQMHPSFQRSIENIQETVENPLKYFCQQEAETLLDHRSKNKNHKEMVKELKEKLFNAEPFSNLDWEGEIADEVSESYTLQISELLSDDPDEYIMSFTHTGDIYLTYQCIAEEGKDDIAGFLEDTLHRILEHNGTSVDVLRIMGAYIPTEKQMAEFEETGEYISMDLGYVIPGQIMCVGKE